MRTISEISPSHEVLAAVLQSHVVFCCWVYEMALGAQQWLVNSLCKNFNVADENDCEYFWQQIQEIKDQHATPRGMQR